MAYTYDDFLKTASAANMLNRFGEEDLKITQTSPEYGLSMLSLMKDQDGAASPEARLLAGEAIKQLRSNYAPAVGAQTATGLATPTATTQQPTAGAPAEETQTQVDAGFQYDKEDEYNKLMEAITNPEAFRYDHEADPNWSAYRKAYLREGERATRDALAKASAATGGIPSTYAVTAAQQAGANYADQLTDLIPALSEDAYNRYLNQQNLKLNAFDALQTERENEYARYLAQQELAAQQEKSNAAGNGNTAATAGKLTEGDLTYLQSAYPNGKVTDKYFWEMMVSVYGEEALTAAGYSYGGPSGGASTPEIRRPGGSKIEAVTGIG